MEDLRRRLRSRDGEIWEAACRELGMSLEREAPSLIDELLRSTLPELRVRGLMCLQARAWILPEEVDARLKRMLDAGEEPDAIMMIAVLQAAGALDDFWSLPLIRRCADDERPAVRAAAANMLGRSEPLESELAPLLATDPSPLVRAATAASLSALEPSSERQRLLEQIARSSESYVAALALGGAPAAEASNLRAGEAFRLPPQLTFEFVAALAEQLDAEPALVWEVLSPHLSGELDPALLHLLSELVSDEHLVVFCRGLEALLSSRGSGLEKLQASIDILHSDASFVPTFDLCAFLIQCNYGLSVNDTHDMLEWIVDMQERVGASVISLQSLYDAVACGDASAAIDATMQQVRQCMAVPYQRPFLWVLERWFDVFESSMTDFFGGDS
jgi:hypothetical protein